MIACGTVAAQSQPDSARPFGPLTVSSNGMAQPRSVPSIGNRKLRHACKPLALDMAEELTPVLGVLDAVKDLRAEARQFKKGIGEVTPENKLFFTE